jgi:hypothetical protein
MGRRRSSPRWMPRAARSSESSASGTERASFARSSIRSMTPSPRRLTFISSRQRQPAQDPADPPLAGAASALLCPLHADGEFVDQPGRALVRRADGEADSRRPSQHARAGSAIRRYIEVTNDRCTPFVSAGATPEGPRPYRQSAGDVHDKGATDRARPRPWTGEGRVWVASPTQASHSARKALN